MSPINHPAQLGNTVAARWRSRLTGDPRNEKSHWRTKTAYYRAVRDLVASGTQPLSWRNIVAAVRPRGSRSTFYEVAGAHARHPLVGDLIEDGKMDSIQIALCYRRSGAVEQLVDETKVWSYWPYREGMLSWFAGRPQSAAAMAEMLVRVLRDWAHSNRRLAAAVDFAPPACAVEDLLVIMPGRLSALRLAGDLTHVLRDASGPPTTPTARSWPPIGLAG